MSIAEKLQTIAENEQRVYEAGKAKGIEEGKKSEYDRFWEDALENAAKGDFAFAGPVWTDESFNPPRGTVLQPPRAAYMFACASITDLADLCEKKGIILDFSKSTSLMDAFYGSYNARFTRIGVVNTTSSNAINQTFYGQSKLHTIVRIILRDDGSQTFTAAFAGCSALENIEIEGVIGKNGFDVSPCTKLSQVSITSIVNALSSTTSGLTVTISKKAKEAAFTDAEWADLIATKSNWTISLN